MRYESRAKCAKLQQIIVGTTMIHTQGTYSVNHVGVGATTPEKVRRGCVVLTPKRRG